jgi:glutaredoxin
MKIEIYSKNGCPFCSHAKNFLDVNGVVFSEYILGEDFEKDFIVKSFPTAKTYPVISIDDTYIGGFSDLQTHFNNIQDIATNHLHHLTSRDNN